jgi:hypothetical protein
MQLIARFREKVRRNYLSFSQPMQRQVESQLILQAQALRRTYLLETRLAQFQSAEFRVFSQWGEDGLISWLVDCLPDIPNTFVEFGVEDYRESNTRLLLHMRNWRGLVLDGSAANIQDIKGQEIYWRYGLTAKCAFIDRDNINSLLTGAGVSGDVGLLSVDIDGNDYWVWQAIDSISPAIVVCEYNAVLGDRHELTVPYLASFQRTRAHHSNLYFGASIKALVRLGEAKGYSFVGTTSTGCNAFFVRNDLAPKVLSRLDSVKAFPSNVRESRDAQGVLTFASGADRLRLISHLPVVDLAADRESPIASLPNVYSPEWLAGQGVSLHRAEQPQSVNQHG